MELSMDRGDKDVYFPDAAPIQERCPNINCGLAMESYVYMITCPNRRLYLANLLQLTLKMSERTSTYLSYTTVEDRACLRGILLVLL